MTDTSLESSEFTIFEELFLGTIWGTTFGCKVTFVRFVDIFLFKNSDELDEFKDSMGTSVVPKKFVLQI